MTTVLGVETKDGFTIAADSRTTSDDRPYHHRDTRKIHVGNGYVVSGAGVSRYVDVVVQGIATLPSANVVGVRKGYGFVVNNVVPVVRRLHEECGYTLKDGESFEFLIGLKGQLYYIAEDYSVLKTDSGVYGLGSGGKYAVGAYMAGASIKDAMAIAIKNDIYSGGMIQIVGG